MFLDESGDHGLSKIDPGFPVFVLCGIIIAEDEYLQLRDEVNRLKEKLWGNKTVILHSRDIRKCDKEFSIFFNIDIKKEFYDGLNSIMEHFNYKVICSAIRKEEYIKRYGMLNNDVYEIALSFIIERAVFYLDEIKDANALDIVIEKRGKKEDSQLQKHFQKVKGVGTYFVKPERIKKYGFGFHFRDKKDNINGLQLADLVAYPTARNVIDPHRANPAFDIVEPKFYSKNGKKYGLKIFP